MEQGFHSSVINIFPQTKSSKAMFLLLFSYFIICLLVNVFLKTDILRDIFKKIVLCSGLGLKARLDKREPKPSSDILQPM